MNLKIAARGFIAFLLSVPALQGDSNWGVTYTSQKICAFRGSTVYISCNLKYPRQQLLQQYLWFAKRKHSQPVDLKADADYTGRVAYNRGPDSCNHNICTSKSTLTLKALRKSDSAEYKFRFITNQPGGGYTGIPGVTLQVIDHLEVITHPPGSRDLWVHLECHSICDLPGYPTYIWYRNDTAMPTSTTRFEWVKINSTDSFSCAVRGQDNHQSPRVYAPRTPSVTVNTSGEIKEGSSVTLSCNSDANPAADYTWFKEHQVSVQESGQNYTITNITSELGGNYYCQAHNAVGRHNSSLLLINVTDPLLSVKITAVAVRTAAVLATTLLFIFLWMRKKRASRKERCQRGGTGKETHPIPVYYNVSALTNRSAPAAQRAPIEEQDGHNMVFFVGDH